MKDPRRKKEQRRKELAEAQNRTDELEQRTAECRQTQEESLENVRDPSEVEILLEEAFKCSPM